MDKKEILDLLLKSGQINSEQAKQVEKEIAVSGVTIEKALEKLGLANEDALARLRADALDIPYIDVASYMIDLELIAFFPEELARKHKAVPLFKMGNVLTVAMVEPQDVLARDHIRRVIKMDIEPVLATERAVLKVLDAHYGGLESVDELVKVIEDEKIVDANEKDIAEIADETPVIKLVNFIVMQAIKDRASDIHIEPDFDVLRVRNRIDGILHEINKLPLNLQRALTSRIKVMASMDISESRRGQDGRIRIKAAGKDLDIRVSTFPTVHGENTVMRLLDKSALVLNLKNLGFPEKEHKLFENLTVQPNGIILVTGPTGSGKTTTLYSVLSSINTLDKNIVTIEDPVEYELPLIRQCSVNPKADITFASGLKIILRQDPDVVMVGEIRDSETAGIAIQASLTGHLVLSTLHTNDAPSAVTRLLDMNVEPFLISSSVIGILAQRLVRRICPKCKENYKPQPEVLQELGLATDTEFFRGAGCEKCKGTGYTGRRGIYELMLMNNELRRLVEARKSSDELKAKAVSQGMMTLRGHGLILVKEGVTTLDEVYRVTREEF